MSVPIAIDKGETENAPVDSAVAKLVLRGDLACGIREPGIGCVIFEAGMRWQPCRQPDTMEIVSAGRIAPQKA
jgi:hypothetical protein